MGMIIIYRILASSQYGDILDETKALNRMADGHRCLQMLQAENGKARYHFLILEGVKRMYLTGSFSPQISISHSRQAASVMFTCYRDFHHWRAKQQRFWRVNDRTGEREPAE